MKCLVTGAGGFIGKHLVSYLIQKKQSVYGLYHGRKPEPFAGPSRAHFLQCDLLNPKEVGRILRRVRPDKIFHLAAQSLVAPSWKDPEHTFRVNVSGTLHLLEAVRAAKINPLIEIFCSSSEYAVPSVNRPIKETDALEPSSPYASSKIAQDFFSVLYHRAYKLKIVRVRPFFIIGPGKHGDVTHDFCRGIVAIERGQARVLKVGDLKVVRDFLSIRDALEAFWVLSEKGKPGEVYNVCSQKGYPVGQLLKRLVQMSSAKIKIQSDRARYRRVEEKIKVGNNAKLRALGWKPRVPFEEILHETLNYWRKK